MVLIIYIFLFLTFIFSFTIVKDITSNVSHLEYKLDEAENSEDYFGVQNVVHSIETT